MKSTRIILLLLIPFAVGLASCKKHADWGYTGSKGPQNWGKLATEYATCDSGKKQSPVNIISAVDIDLPVIAFDYAKTSQEILNNGHTIQISFGTGNSITISGKSFELKQFHFHAPSENQVDGKSFPMEAHFVHASKEGKLAVVGVFIERGAKNEELEKAWKGMPKNAGEKGKLESEISALKLFPVSRDYYRFEGSLTTPPCSEGVEWMVMKKTVQASADQIKKFSDLMKHPTNRPVQKINERKISQ